MRTKTYFTVRNSLVLMVGSWFILTLYTSTKLSILVPLKGDKDDAGPTESRTTSYEPVLGDLVWITPPPLSKPRMIGWEDSFMKRFKNEHFDPIGKVGCENHQSRTPYRNSEWLCNIPGYLPARYVPEKTQKIPRTIFLSWRSRSINPRMFTSIVATLSHNPEYELMFFDDDDIDRLVCDLYPDMAPHFGRLRAGAARADVFRMIAIYHYGGIYIDADLTCFGHIDVPANASLYGSVGGWGHIYHTGGVLNHWAMAFAQWHPVVGTTLNYIWDNLRDPENPLVASEQAIAGSPSETMRLTGPAPYQRAVHDHLRRAGCRPETTVINDENHTSFTTAMLNPQENCNMTAFEEEFGIYVVTKLSQWDEVCLSKEVVGESEQYWHGRYDDGSTKYLPEPQINFCTDAEFENRLNLTRSEWDYHINQRNMGV